MENTTLKCEECGKVLKNRKAYAGHMWLVHQIRIGKVADLQREIARLKIQLTDKDKTEKLQVVTKKPEVVAIKPQIVTPKPQIKEIKEAKSNNAFFSVLLFVIGAIGITCWLTRKKREEVKTEKEIGKYREFDIGGGKVIQIPTEE